jgi:hypothetical protein
MYIRDAHKNASYYVQCAERARLMPLHDDDDEVTHSPRTNTQIYMYVQERCQPCARTISFIHNEM